MGDYVAVIVELNHAAHELGGRHISGEHEHAECAVVGGLPSFGLARGAVKNGRLAQTALARGDALELHVVAHVDLRIFLASAATAASQVKSGSRTSTVTLDAYLVRNTDSSAAANPPPTTSTSLRVKNSPSQVAQ